MTWKHQVIGSHTAAPRMEFTILPHGGTLCWLLAGAERAEPLKAEARDVRAVVLSPRQLSDLDLLLNGGFSLLRGFLGRTDYDSVLDTMRLESGLLWPIPVTLDVPDALAEGLAPGERLALQDPEGFTHALLTVGDVWRPDKRREAQAVYGTDSDAHPGVRYLYERTHDTHIGDTVSGGRIAAPVGRGSPRRHRRISYGCGGVSCIVGGASPRPTKTTDGAGRLL